MSVENFSYSSSISLRDYESVVLRSRESSLTVRVNKELFGFLNNECSAEVWSAFWRNVGNRRPAQVLRSIGDTFNWATSPEGSSYWASVYNSFAVYKADAIDKSRYKDITPETYEVL